MEDLKRDSSYSVSKGIFCTYYFNVKKCHISNEKKRNLISTLKALILWFLSKKDFFAYVERLFHLNILQY